MRSHNHSIVKNYCRTVIPNLMDKHGLGKIAMLQMDTEGWVNPCFFVNDKFVVRFNARDPGLPKYNREKIIFDLLRDSKIPVPQKVILDTDKDVCQFDVLITEMLSGSNTELHWKSFLPEKREFLSVEAGEILKELHNFKFKYFGEIAGEGPLPQTKSWYEFLEAKLIFLLNEAKALSVFNQGQEQAFLNMLSSRKADLDRVKESSLVHVDFHFGNLLYNKDRIVGVVDFEWAIAGDPLYDLMSWCHGDETFPGSQDGFLKGYGKQRFSVLETRLISLYQMIKNIELTIVAAQHFPKKEAEDYLGLTLQQFASLAKAD